MPALITCCSQNEFFTKFSAQNLDKRPWNLYYSKIVLLSLIVTFWLRGLVERAWVPVCEVGFSAFSGGTPNRLPKRTLIMPSPKQRLFIPDPDSPLFPYLCKPNGKSFHYSLLRWISYYFNRSFSGGFTTVPSSLRSCPALPRSCRYVKHLSITLTINILNSIRKFTSSRKHGLLNFGQRKMERGGCASHYR